MQQAVFGCGMHEPEAYGALCLKQGAKPGLTCAQQPAARRCPFPILPLAASAARLHMRHHLPNQSFYTPVQHRLPFLLLVRGYTPAAMSSFAGSAWPFIAQKCSAFMSSPADALSWISWASSSFTTSCVVH